RTVPLRGRHDHRPPRRPQIRERRLRVPPVRPPGGPPGRLQHHPLLTPSASGNAGGTPLAVPVRSHHHHHVTKGTRPMATTKTRTKRRPRTEAQKARDAVSKAAANDALHNYAV